MVVDIFDAEGRRVASYLVHPGRQPGQAALDNCIDEAMRLARRDRIVPTRRLDELVARLRAEA
jgi:hypothetical protein